MSTKKNIKKDFKEEILIPENVKLELFGSLIKITGPKGNNERRLTDPKISIKIEGNKIILSSKRYKLKEKRILQTFKAHISNMINGALNDHIYRLKICSGHFPMNVSVSNNKLIIKNFFV